MHSQIRRHASEFARDDRGSVAVLFGVIFLALVMCVGIAVDYARSSHAKSEIAAAADAAALAAGRALMSGGMSDAEISEIGLKFFNENIQSSGAKFANIADVRIIPNRATSTIEVTVDANVPMTFMRVAGHEQVNTVTDTSTTFDLITHLSQPSWRHCDLPNSEQFEGDDYGAKSHSISEGSF